ncbi:MAG TPA: efflux RND transporter periplasmic adaptor subunit [Candidatus Enterocola sp.]|nr:efflux RND transporter periplasmic adaptor subunit [Candidatus Enterocola sp.]
MNAFKYIIIGTFILFTAGIISIAILQQNKDLPYTTARFRDINKELVISGQIDPLKEIEIKSPISGILEHLYVQIGDTITTGQAIARVQFVRNPVELKQLLKELEVSKTRYQTQQKQFERSQSLYQKGVISSEDYEKEQSTFAIYKQEYLALLSEYDMLQGKYEEKGISNIIQATGSGTILDLPIKEGGSVMARGALSEGTSVVRIADLKSLVFSSDVTEAHILKLHIGDSLHISVATDPTQKIIGIISLISPVASLREGQRRFSIKADIKITHENAPFLRAGSSATAHVILEGEKQVLSIEESMLIFENDSCYVEIIDKKDHIQKQAIHTGISDGVYIEIKSGIDSTSHIKL